MLGDEGFTPIQTYQPSFLPDGSFTLSETSQGQLFHNRAGAWVEATQLYTSHTCAWCVEVSQGLTSVDVIDACFGLGYNTWALVLGVLWIKAGKPTLPSAWVNHPLWAWWITQPEGLYERLALLQEVMIFGSDTALPQLIPLWYDALETACGDIPQAERPEWLTDFLAWMGFRTTVLTTLPLSSSSLWEHTFYQGGFRLNFQLTTTPLQWVIPHLKKCHWHVVYHDPFTYDILPALWTPELFQSYQEALVPGGILLTYSCAGKVQRALKASGFELTPTARVGKKRSKGTRATRHPA
jgi:hypothetical protein